MKNDNIRPAVEIYEQAMQRYLPGLVTFQECDICGFLEWSSTATKEPDGYFVEPRHGNCPRCQEVLARSPEIALWVMNVVLKAQRDLTHNVELTGAALLQRPR